MELQTIILVLHVLAALALVGLILLQQGKGADIGASFGAGASQTLFGSAGTTSFLARVTAILAAVFFLTSLGLGYMAKQAVINLGEIEVEDLAQPIAKQSDLPQTSIIAKPDDLPVETPKSEATSAPAAQKTEPESQQPSENIPVN